MNWIGFAIISIGFSRLAAIMGRNSLLFGYRIELKTYLVSIHFYTSDKTEQGDEFLKGFIIQASGVIVGGIVGVVMAYSGFGVWSLVGQSLSGSLVNLPVAWF